MDPKRFAELILYLRYSAGLELIKMLFDPVEAHRYYRPIHPGLVSFEEMEDIIRQWAESLSVTL